MSTIEAGKNPRDIILKPVTTEKSLALMDLGKYTFEVDPRANKTEIKIALERIFGVKIGSIATQNRKGKTFISIEEFSAACPKVSKAHIEGMKQVGAFDGMPETSQITLF